MPLLDESSELDLVYFIEGEELIGKGHLSILESRGEVVDDERGTTPDYLRRYRFTGEVDCASVETATCTGIWSFDLEGEQTTEDVYYYDGDPTAY